jgi:hypothetical protein
VCKHKHRGLCQRWCIAVAQQHHACILGCLGGIWLPCGMQKAASSQSHSGPHSSSREGC